MFDRVNPHLDDSNCELHVLVFAFGSCNGDVHKMTTMMKRLLSVNLLSFAFIGVVVNANSHLPRAIQYKIAKDDVSVTPVDYGGNHPFEQRNRRKLEDLVLSDIPNEINRDSYEPLRIKYITDPIKASPNYSSNFNSTLEEILSINSETWSKHLSVFPVVGAIPISREDCFGFFGDYIPESLIESGVEGADMVIYVGEGESIVVQNDDGQVEELCSAQTLAFAVACSIDQIDRPVIGTINFCINTIERRRRQLLEVTPLEEGELDSSIVEGNPPVQKVVEGNTPFADLAHVAVHEVAHALGFSFELFKYFRDPVTGEPLTPRPFQPSQVICADGSVQTLTFPSTNTVDVGTTFDGRYYHEIVTPRVTQVARNHFDCQSLSGARLENQPASIAECVGSHWDERLFLSELMGPIFSGYTDNLSPLTLALFDDSGWYKVSYDGAPNSPFGKGRGCDFVNQPCIVNDGVPEYGRDAFCDTQSFFDSTGISNQELVCDPTHKSVSACDLFDINNIPAEIQPSIPEDRVQYFSDSNLVSTFSQADFCPVAAIPTNLDCTNQIDLTEVQTYQGEVRGPTSRCINGQISGGLVRAGCFEIECSATQHKVIIAGQTCDVDGQELSVTAMDSQSAVIECPYLATICPDLFCPAECSGAGECDYTVVPPVCRCLDDQDTSASCNMTESVTRRPSSGAPTIFTPPPSTSDAPQRMFLASSPVAIPLALFGLHELW